MLTAKTLLAIVYDMKKYMQMYVRDVYIYIVQYVQAKLFGY